MPFKEQPKFYHVWQAMKDRCYNPRNRQYKDYGQRGIRVCDRWLNDYKTFESDMGHRPKGYSIDRIDNDGNYEPSNCRWADRRTQQRNQRRAVFVTIGGRKYRAIVLAELAGVKTDTIIDRATRGLPLEAVVSSEALRDLSGLALGGQANGQRNREKTQCKHGHEFTPANTYFTKEGWRNCRQCKNIKMKRRTAEKRAARLA